jgi:uncharacterized protein YuzE
MAKEKISIYYDKEGDYFEIMFKKKKGYFKETENDSVMEKVDENGNVIGFSVLNASSFQNKPLEVYLDYKVA